MGRLLIGVGLVAMGGFLAGVALDIYWLRLVSKPLPVACMVLWLWQRDKAFYEWGVFVGLLLSICGDMLIEISPGLFVAGLVAFLLAHLCYIASYISVTRRPALLQLVPFMAYGVSLFAYLYGPIVIKEPAMLGPVAVYAVVICVMMWRATVLLQEQDIQRRAAWMATFGAIIFAISDSVIAINKFVQPFSAARYLIILTYWLGQLGILFSVLRYPPQPDDEQNPA